MRKILLGFAVSMLPLLSAAAPQQATQNVLVTNPIGNPVKVSVVSGPQAVNKMVDVYISSGSFSGEAEVYTNDGTVPVQVTSVGANMGPGASCDTDVSLLTVSIFTSGGILLFQTNVQFDEKVTRYGCAYVANILGEFTVPVGAILMAEVQMPYDNALGSALRTQVSLGGHTLE